MNIYRKNIEQVKLFGPLTEVKKALDWCYARGYRVLRSGPKPIGRYGAIDMQRYKIVAEREDNKK